MQAASSFGAMTKPPQHTRHQAGISLHIPPHLCKFVGDPHTAVVKPQLRLLPPAAAAQVRWEPRSGKVGVEGMEWAKNSESHAAHI